MSWNANNRAHACLWLVETWHHGQRDAGFDEVGGWKTDFLIKAAAGESAAMRQGKVEAHAALLDEVFTSLYRATYEPGKTRTTALADLGTVLADSAKTAADLADVVDTCFRFRGEI
jgi:hypothetical protein